MEAMLARLSTARNVSCASDIRPTAALGGIGTTATPTVVGDGQFLAAIIGTPSWSSPNLQVLASRSGHAAALLQAYRLSGINLLKDLHGAFALAVLDLNNRSTLLATDRMGICPLSYAIRPAHGLAFASTATAVQAHPAFRSALDPQAVYLYLYFHVVPSPYTIFADQQKLEPAQYLRYADGRAETGFYWNPEFHDDNETPVHRLGLELRDTLQHAVHQHASDNATVGAFLSGGVDSSTVAGFLAARGRGPAKTFSIGFDAPGYDEIQWARATSRHFGTEQHEYYVTPADVLRAVPEIVRAYDEPFGNSSAVAVYYCAKLAADHGVDCLLAGDGGDELFGGNTRYAKQKVFDIYWRLPTVLRQRFIEPLLLSTRGLNWLAPLRKARSYVEQARVPMPQRLDTYNFLYRTPLQEVLTSTFAKAVDTTLPSRLIAETYARARSPTLVNRMLYLDWKFTLADNDLRKVNRTAELAGVEVRYPLLADELVEFSTRVPTALKVKGTKLRFFFKEALRDFLPSAVLTKSKHGFGLPFGVWMREYAPLQELAYGSLEQLKQREILRGEYIDRLIALHRDDHAAYYGEFIWVLMMLELWLASHGPT